MKINCRGCKNEIPDKVLLCYKNMPKSAQFFPIEGEVDEEKGVDIMLYQCPYCGLIQATGEPVYYYRDVIRATGVSEEMRLFRESQYQKWVDTYQLHGKKVIEIGCGVGEYMTMMETTGAKVRGLEHLKDSVEKGKAEGHNILQGFVEDETFLIEDGLYDGFYSMNFLEHIPNPGAFLRGIAGNLSEGAVGLVEVPNFDMMLEKSLYSEFIQDHLSYFTKETLCGLLERNGFEVISCENIWYDYILSAVVRKRRQVDVSGLLESHEALKKEMNRFLLEQEEQGRKIAVWGAGHQALANLSLLDMADRIAYVVDSAKFKQDKYTPATHIPIVAPEHLKKNDVQMVIIMAAGYSQEVKQIMKKDYPQIQSVILTESGIEYD